MVGLKKKNKVGKKRNSLMKFPVMMVIKAGQQEDGGGEGI